MKKIIITGATSMLGLALTEVSLREGAEVYAIIRSNTKRRERIVSSEHVHVVYSELENLGKIDELPNDCDVFYHFAWAGAAKSTRDDPVIHEQNIKYTLDAVELANRAGCHRFVFAGSQAEYGPVYGRIDENTKFAPTTAYGVAKYSAGILSRKFCERIGMEHVWGRVFSVYGPHDNTGTMLENAIRTWSRGETAYFSSGMQVWNYLYESDAGEIFYKLGHSDIPEGTYFIANQNSGLLKEYIDILMKTYGSGAKAEFAEPASERLPGLDVDASRTFEVLGYRPNVSFEEGIRKMTDALGRGVN